MMGKRGRGKGRGLRVEKVEGLTMDKGEGYGWEMGKG